MNALTNLLLQTEKALSAGSMTEHGSGTTVSAPSSWKGWVSSAADIQTTGYVTWAADAVNGDTLVVGASGAGLYLCQYKCAFNGVNAETYRTSLFQNAIQLLQSDSFAQLLTGALYQTLCGQVLVTLAAADVIRLKVKSDGGNNMYLNYTTVSIVRL